MRVVRLMGSGFRVHGLKILLDWVRLRVWGYVMSTHSMVVDLASEHGLFDDRSTIHRSERGSRRIAFGRKSV